MVDLYSVLVGVDEVELEERIVPHRGDHLVQAAGPDGRENQALISGPARSPLSGHFSDDRQQLRDQNLVRTGRSGATSATSR
jgi:hypothetical protein